MDPGGGTVAVLAEKPSVARDIARVLGARSKGEGYLHGNGYMVTWAIGHLVSLAQPHEIRAEWKHLAPRLLPMLPGDWPLVVYEKTRDQFEVVRENPELPARGARGRAPPTPGARASSSSATSTRRPAAPSR